MPSLLDAAECEVLRSECDNLTQAMAAHGERVDEDADCVVEPFSRQTASLAALTGLEGSSRRTPPRRPPTRTQRLP